MGAGLGHGERIDGTRSPPMTSIAERPADAATRMVPTHWEGDLIKGARHGSAFGTMVERTPRPALLALLERTNAGRACLGFLELNTAGL